MSNIEDDHEKYRNWPKLDPFDDRLQWLDDGLSVGINSAVKDGLKIRQGLINQLSIIIYQLAAISLSFIFSSRQRRKKQPAKSINQIPWLPIWPNLRAEPFHEDQPEWIQQLKENYPAIKNELEALINNQQDSFERAIYDGFKGDTWTAKYFDLLGERIDSTHTECPITSEVLKNIPQNFMHTCFSCIPPGGALPPHVGPTNTSLVCHFGLINCEKTAIFSGDKFKIYQEGQALILDDSFVHGVKNTSDQPRYTLMFSFLHPDLSSVERKCLKFLYKFILPSKRW